ncbi:MAG: tRNA 2-thiouridine(34) synthase MnmA [Actinomycetota bacterium]|nr:tRNA 2-thiouridine(34) synthase MnmA [Actinomycetota bacterium]
MDINSSKYSQYSQNHINYGEITQPDATGTSSVFSCGGHIKFTARITGNIISDIKFRASGCNYITAAAGYLTTLAKNRDLLDSTLITEKEIEDYLGEFPEGKKHVPGMVIAAFQNLITDYISKPHTKNIYKKNINRVAVALSGGIDSSMIASMLKDEGMDLIGVTMRLLPSDTDWKDINGMYRLNSDIRDARMVSLQLEIPHIVIDLTELFEERIIEPFCSEYSKGRTPNPCVECNKYIKFGALLDKVKMLGAEYLATGHYCRINKSEISGLYEIKKGIDPKKDQSYVLWKLDQDTISHIKTPAGNLHKSKIKEEAKKVFPFLRDKSESQDICFIKGNSYHTFIKSKITNINEGPILNTGGKVIGMHKGYVFYTIGQRKGLGVSHTKPLYVKEIIPEKNIIIAGEETDIIQKSFNVSDINFIAGEPPADTFKAMVKIRYNSREAPASIKLTGKNSANITFDEPHTAITPGQSAVFYNGEILIGGGIII